MHSVNVGAKAELLHFVPQKIGLNKVIKDLKLLVVVAGDIIVERMIVEMEPESNWRDEIAFQKKSIY